MLESGQQLWLGRNSGGLRLCQEELSGDGADRCCIFGEEHDRDMGAGHPNLAGAWQPHDVLRRLFRGFSLFPVGFCRLPWTWRDILPTQGRRWYLAFRFRLLLLLSVRDQPLQMEEAAREQRPLPHSRVGESQHPSQLFRRSLRIHWLGHRWWFDVCFQYSRVPSWAFLVVCYPKFRRILGSALLARFRNLRSEDSASHSILAFAPREPCSSLGGFRRVFLC